MLVVIFKCERSEESYNNNATEKEIWLFQWQAKQRKPFQANFRKMSPRIMIKPIFIYVCE